MTKPPDYFIDFEVVLEWNQPKKTCPVCQERRIRDLMSMRQLQLGHGPFDVSRAAMGSAQPNPRYPEQYQGMMATLFGGAFS